MSASPKRVLIVEDQRLVAADLEDTLKRLGYAVAGNVASGEEAVAAAIEARPELALMDIRLSGEMDGIETARAIRERMDIPVIYLTAYADEETVRRAMITGPFGYLVKPFNERELRASIDIAIYKHGTDRLLAEERARREAAEEFKFLVEGVEDYAIFLLDLSGRVTTWNAGAERTKGYTPAEIIGRPFSVFYSPEDIQAGKPDAELKAALERGRIAEEAWRVRKDGSRFWASVAINVLRDERGQARGFAKVTRDMTARRAAELELKQGVARMQAMVTAALDCVISMDAHGRLTDWNPAAEETFGYTREEAIGREMAELIIPERLRAQHRAGLDRYLRTGSGPILGRRIEMPAVTKEKREIVIELNVVRIPVGQAPNFTAFVRDITARKRAEVDNARLYSEAQDAIRARDEFLQVASHELKTPLTPLQLQLDTLARTLEKTGPPNERLSARLELATRQTARLTRLVESLLDVSRITSGKFILERERVDLSELVRDVTDRFRGEAKKAGSEVKVTAEDRIEGRWDPLKIEQIISNLVSNAIKYGSSKPIEIDVRERDGAVRVAVTDHGIGIEKEALSRIFGRFERGVSLRHYGGLGLGLFIAQQFAEAHGGKVVAESEPRAGSTFTLTLPVTHGDPHDD